MTTVKAISRSILFPDTPRDFPGRRISRAALRTVHILGGGVLVGACLFEQGPDTVHAWLLVAALSGLLLLATDLHASCAIVFEVRGLAVLAKLALLVPVAYLPGWEVPLLVLILTIGAVSSHLSRGVRHRLWWSVPGIRNDRRRG